MNLLLAGRFDPAEHDLWRKLLSQAMPQHHLVSAGELFDRTRIEVALVADPPAGSLAGLPKLRLIQSLRAGGDALLDDPTLPVGVPVARLVDPAVTAAMAETALWAVLSLHRGFFVYQRQQRNAVWQPLPQRRADELPVAVLGVDALGAASARALAQQGYRVTAWTPEAPDAVLDVPDGVTLLQGADALTPCLNGSSIVVNLLPLTAATRGLLDAQFFAALPRGAALVNLASGAHVVEADLRAALLSGRLGHAVLDVFDQEPLEPNHPFWRHPKVTVLPHIAALADPHSAALVAAANVQALTEGRPIEHLIER